MHQPRSSSGAMASSAVSRFWCVGHVACVTPDYFTPPEYSRLNQEET